MADHLDLSPIPAPMQEMNERAAALRRAAHRLGLDLNHPGNWERIGAEAGINPPASTCQITDADGVTRRLSFQIKVF